MIVHTAQTGASGNRNPPNKRTIGGLQQHVGLAFGAVRQIGRVRPGLKTGLMCLGH